MASGSRLTERAAFQVQDELIPAYRRSLLKIDDVTAIEAISLTGMLAVNHNPTETPRAVIQISFYQHLFRLLLYYI